MFGIDVALAVLGARKWLSRVFSAVAGFIKDNPWRALAILSLLAFVWAWRGWGGEEEDHAATTRDWKAAAVAWKTASDANHAKAIAQVAQTEAKYLNAAKDQDYAHAASTSQVIAARDRYAAANRVRAGQEICLGPAATPGENPASPAPDGPGAMPEMVAVPRQEFDDYVANTVRLDRIVNGYVPALIKDKLAEKVVYPSPDMTTQP